jgi:hypothetical protein
MASIVTGDLYHKIDGQLLEIKRQLRQREGYPYKLEDLQKSLQDSIEGRFGPPTDGRFSLMLMSEPIIIPKINITACVEKYRSSMGSGMDFEWEYFQPSEPLRPGRECQLYVYLTRKHISEFECIQFIKQQGGVLPNLHGLFIALEKKLLPTNITCSIAALDEGKHLAPTGPASKHHRIIPSVFCVEEGSKDLPPGNILQFQFWDAGIHKGSCIMFFK